MQRQEIIQTKLTFASYGSSPAVDAVSVEVAMPNFVGIRIHDIPRRALEKPEGMAAFLTLAAEEYRACLEIYLDQALKRGVE